MAELCSVEVKSEGLDVLQQSQLNGRSICDVFYGQKMLLLIEIFDFF